MATTPQATPASAVKNCWPKDPVPLEHLFNEARLRRDLWKDKVVLISGATGFFGQCILEALLRRYGADIKEVLLLIRPSRKDKQATARADDPLRSPESPCSTAAVMDDQKSDEMHDHDVEAKGSAVTSEEEVLPPVDQSVEDRLNVLLAGPAFAKLQRLADGRKIRDVVTGVSGNMELVGLGLNAAHAKYLRSRVQIIIHSAANTYFKAPCWKNAGLVLNLLRELKATKWARLEALVHISSSFVCMQLEHGQTAVEKLMPMAPKLDQLHQRIVQLHSTFAQEALASQSTFLEGHQEEEKELAEMQVAALAASNQPTPYTMSKTICEHLIADFASSSAASGVHVGILRPCMIEPALVHPYPSFVIGMSASGGMALALGMNLHQGIFPRADTLSMSVPADFASSDVLGLTTTLLEQATVIQAAPRPGCPLVVHSVWRSPTFAESMGVTVEYFREHPLSIGLGKPEVTKVVDLGVSGSNADEWFAQYRSVPEPFLVQLCKCASCIPALKKQAEAYEKGRRRMCSIVSAYGKFMKTVTLETVNAERAGKGAFGLAPDVSLLSVREYYRIIAKGYATALETAMAQNRGDNK